MKNKLAISDAGQLKKLEYEFTAQRSQEILEQNALSDVQGYGLERLRAIHGHLFQDVYEWAGKVRSVPSAKRMDNGMVSRFSGPETITEDWQALEQKTNAFVKSKGLSFEQKREALVDVFAEANRIHAFPEGNGRSLQVFMKSLAREQGIELDFSKINRHEWNKASALSGTYGRLFERIHFTPLPRDIGPLQKAFASIASPMREHGHHAYAEKESREALSQRPTHQDVKAYEAILKDKGFSPEKREAIINSINQRMLERDKGQLVPASHEQQARKSVEVSSTTKSGPYLER